MGAHFMEQGFEFLPGPHLYSVLPNHSHVPASSCSVSLSLTPQSHAMKYVAQAGLQLEILLL